MTKNIDVRLPLVIILSIIFTVTLYYLTLEIPHIIDRILRAYFPDVFFNPELREQILNNLRPIGYLSLVITSILIVLGFLFKRGYLSTIGSITMYIPIFGYFAFAMFFLAGIGVLRAIWLPLIEYSPKTLELGSIVLIPYIILMHYTSWSITYMISKLSALVLIFIGLIIFTLGTATWLYGKFKGAKIIDFWIYKYIRHPQYLGYVIWSYGLLVFISFKPYIKGAFTVPPSYPWLISTLIIIGVALFEEIKMKEQYGEEYINYINRTSFMIPLPKQMINIIKWPLKIRGKDIEGIKDIVIVLITYLIILAITSYIINVNI